MSKNDYRITVIADDRESKGEVIQFLSEKGVRSLKLTN
jgi:ERCC4-type nuclease